MQCQRFALSGYWSYLGSILGLHLQCDARSRPGRTRQLGPDGKMTQNLALTAAQKKAIHDAVFQQR